VKRILVNPAVEWQLFSVYEAACQSAELFDATVAEERPPATDVLATLHIYVDQQEFFRRTGFSQELSLGTGNEAVSPELNALSLSGRIVLVTAAIDGDHG
jgi:hypothetical protein